MIIISVFLLAVAVVLFAMYFFQDKIMLRKAKKEIQKDILQYRERLTGDNRFISNLESLRKRYPEYDDGILKVVFEELKNKNMIVLDDRDNEWCIKK